MQDWKQKIKYIMALVPVTFALVGCGADFTSVAKFGDSRTYVKTASDEFADDIYKSCLRRAGYILLIPDDGISLRESTEEQCQKINKVSTENFKRAVSVLINYMAVLATIADNKKFNFDEPIAELGTSIENLSINGQRLDAATVQGGTSILQAIIDLVTKKIREDAIRKAVICTNDPIHEYITGSPTPTTDAQGIDLYKKPAIGGLIFIVEEGYIKGILVVEKEQIKSYYSFYFTKLGKLPESQVGDQAQIEREYDRAMDTVFEKEEAAIAYTQILWSTVRSHNNLRKEFQGKMSDESVQNLCQQNSKVTLEKMDEEQLQRLRKILTDYVAEVKPLLEKVDRAF